MKFKKEINWGPTLFLITYQVLLIASLPVYFFYYGFSLVLFLLMVVFLYATGLSITAGYHRFYAHRSYKTNKGIELLLLFFASLSAQGSALRWAFDHRIHHAFVDTDRDPYCIKKGFWYAHFLWILDPPRPVEEKVVSDLFKNKLVMFQHNFYTSSMLFSNIFLFLLMGWILNDYIGSLVMIIGVRMLLLHHFTWFINSLAHTWGDRPFCQEQTAVNNFVIALLTFGEGYHNFHHTFANDYRNGIRWFHFDPTKWLIWTLEKCGLAHSLKTVDALTIKKRLVMERKNLLIDAVSKKWDEKKDEMQKKIDELSSQILKKISEFDRLKIQYRQLKKACQKQEMIDAVKAELKDMKRSIREDWRMWHALSRHIMA